MRETESVPAHCDVAKLDGALNRPQWQAAIVGIADPVTLGCHLAMSIACSHSFSDGNKRTAYTTLGVFLSENGYQLTTSVADETIATGVEQLVEAYHVSEGHGEAQLERFIAYIRTVTVRRSLPR
nr:DOC_P1: death-on-curing family [uncultured bacterium]